MTAIQRNQTDDARTKEKQLNKDLIENKEKNVELIDELEKHKIQIKQQQEKEGEMKKHISRLENTLADAQSTLISILKYFIYIFFSTK